MAEILDAAGADLSRVIMGHMDTAVCNHSYLQAVAEKGCVIEFDLFGNETFHAEYGFAIPGDSEKIHAVVMLIRRGFASQLLLSHDTATKTQLTRYGGYGYGHLLRNIAPRLELAGLEPAEVDRLLRANPQRLFP